MRNPQRKLRRILIGEILTTFERRCYNSHINTVPSYIVADSAGRRPAADDEVNSLNGYEVLNVPRTATRDEIRTAYRDLARRWHPDRFMPGPERDWANERMAAINAAYRLCLDGLTDARLAVDSEGEALQRVQALIDGGEYQSARRLLMGFNTRCAEWNYLFGAVLLNLAETDKALIYLSVAAHQAPKCAKYARALEEARGRQATHRLTALFARRR